MESRKPDFSKHLQALIKNASVAAAMFDRGMRYLAWSRRWRIDCRLGDRDLRGVSEYDVFPEMSPDWKAVHQRCLAGATESRDEDSLIRSNGLVDHFRWSVHPWYEDNGAVGGLIIFAELLTDQKLTEVCLHRGEERFSAFMAHLPAVAFVKDETGRVLFANKYMQDLMGPPALEGRFAREIIPGALGQRMEEDDRKALAHGSLKIEQTLVDARGTARIFETLKFPIRVEGRPTLLGGIAFDITEHRRAEQALRESTQHYLTVANCVPDTIFSSDLSGNITYVSPSVERAYGWTVEETLKRTRWDLITPRQASKSNHLLTKELERASSPGYDRNRVLTFESEQLRKDGTFFWAEINASFVWSEDGRPIGWTAVARDITDRKRADAERERFKAIFDQTFQFIGLLKTDGTVIEANRAVLEFAGISEQDVRGMPLWETAWWSHSPDLQAQLRQAISVAAAGEFVRFEVTHPRSDGSLQTVDFSLKPVRDEEGRITLLIPEGRDITERKIAEKAREEAERQYREIFEGAVEGYFRTSPEGKSLSANPALVRMLGYGSPEELAATITDSARQVWVTPAERSKYVQLLEEQGVVRGYECQCKRKDGTMLWVSLNSRKVCGPDGNTLYHEGFIEDISARKQAEAEREKLSSQLAQVQKMESIGRLAGGVAHDFNNLLSVINGHSRLALSKLAQGDPLRARFEEILKAGERAARLTQQLLAFSRKQMLQPSIFNLNGVVRGMRSMLEHLMGDDIDVQFGLHGGDIPVFADPHQLEQVIMNLAVNARDAMPAGGCLHVETKVVDWDDAHLPPHLDTRAGRYAVLAVADTGSGMDEATRQRMFEPFFTTKEAGSGTGLGLSMVQGIVAQSGGHIDVDTALGRGAEFKIYLPLQDAATTEPEKPMSVPSLGGEETVLVVEDRAEVRDYAAEALRHCGYRVIEAANAEDAMTLCTREAPPIHLVLADVMMPGIGGVELIARLTKVKPGIKVLLMSGSSEDILRARLQCEASGFIQKPFSPDELGEKVRKALKSTSLG